MVQLVFTGQHVRFSSDDIIVSKTDLKGVVTYANQTFCEVSGYKESDILGQPHSVIRHSNMPRCVFKLLWEYITSGREVFAYVVNRTIDNNYYWVFAHATPSFDSAGHIIGYHSNRRSPDMRIVESVISPLYFNLLDIEKRAKNRRAGMNDAYDHLVSLLKESGKDYEEFILTL